MDSSVLSFTSSGASIIRAMSSKFLARSLYYCCCFISSWWSFKFYCVAPLSSFRDPSLDRLLITFFSELSFVGGYFLPILNELFKSLLM